MKTIFHPEEKEQILLRLEKLSQQSKAQWGKMNVSQMLAHCATAMRVPLGEYQPKPEFISIMGRFMKKSILSEKPFGKNAPTAKAFVIKDERQFETEKKNFLDAFRKLTQGETAVKHDIHPILVKMLPQEWGRLHYKHIDHHFRQFGA
jgi:hypothetical protein